MTRLLQSSIGRLRLAAYLEATSFLVLLGIAMPLKYLAGRPEAVHVTGMLHGILFMLYLSALVTATIEHRWGKRTFGLLFVAALLPFGPFYADAKLLKPAQV